MATQAATLAEASEETGARAEEGKKARAEAETEAAASAFRHCDTMKEALKNMPAKGEGGTTMHACARVCVRVCVRVYVFGSQVKQFTK